MNYYHINGTLTSELFDDFIEKANNFKPEPLTIYLSSPGGEVGVAEAFCDFINNYDYDVTIYAYTEVSSCAGTLFFFSNSKKVISDKTIVLLHLGSFDISVREERNQHSNEVVTTYKSLDLINSDYIARMKEIGVEPTILNKVEAYEDVFITGTDVVQLAIRAQNLYFRPKGD